MKPYPGPLLGQKDFGFAVNIFQITYLKNVLQALKGNCDDTHIRAVQQVAQGLDAACSNQVLDLVMGAAAGGIADCPGTLFSNIKFCGCQQMHQGWDDVVLNDRLYRLPQQDSIPLGSLTE